MDLSVVIPTRDRRDRLLRTLDALDRQQLDGVAAEVIVVDNGSAGDTVNVLGGRRGGLPLRALSHPSGGASGARNAGIDAAGGAVILMLGDDTEPATGGLIASHAELHRRRPDSSYAVLGRIDWSPEIERTPFLRWLDREGFQYHYDRIPAGPVAMTDYFYSSHASVKRSILLEVGKFDERLTFLGEDTELGIRLARGGCQLDYHPELLVHHDHPQDVEQYARRMEVAGRAARTVHELWPDDASMDRPTPRGLAYPLAAPVARALLRAGVRGPVREKAWSAILMAAYRRGYRAGPAPAP